MWINTHNVLKGAILFSMATWISGGLAVGQMDPWERVRLLEEGKSVSVTLHSGGHVNGKMEAWSAEGVRIQQGRAIVPVEKAKIARVELVIGPSRGTKAAIAGGITAGVVASLLLASCAQASCRASEYGKVTGVASGVFGGGAAGIAALFPQHHELIYVAPPPTGSWRSVRLLYSQGATVSSGRIFRLTLQVLGEGGRDLSSTLLPLRATGVSSALDLAAPVTPLSVTAGDGDTFRWDSRLGSYSFAVDTTGLQPGMYFLHFQIGSDPHDHTAPFAVK